MASEPGSQNIEKLLGEAAAGDLTALMLMWRARDAAQWAGSPELYQSVARQILGQGEPLLAYDVITEGLSIWPADIRLRQLQGLALARTGATERANSVLEDLRREGASDEETLGMLGRTYKDLAAQKESPEREAFLRRAGETYEEAYEKSGGYWTGINAATMNLLIGEKGRACQIANQVRQQCLKEVEDPEGDQYWEMAALGEAALICQDWLEAEKWYGRAGEERKERFGDLQSSRRNARLILDYWQKDAPPIEQLLHVPPVIVFVGHMIDRPDRAAPRFPNELESFVATEIKQKLDRLKPAFGFSSAASGSDIVFLEAMLERGCEVSIVLPYGTEEFVRDSVAFIPGSNWRARFDRVLAGAARILTASTERLAIGGVSYEFCNQMLLGLATIRARQLNTDLIPLAVWNGRSGDGPGGAATVVQKWRSIGYEPEIIDIERILEGHAPSCPKYSGAVSAALSKVEEWGANQFASRIVAVLFADAVGFSKLTEREVPRFVEHFLGGIAKLSEGFEDTILARNTWGDGLYFIFSQISAAGKFALKLAELIAKADWESKALPA
ncbi:MAG: hypothetical protein QOI34_892, partial [Verrucomicrobiota bacterium]